MTIEDLFRVEIPVGCVGRITHDYEGDTQETLANIDGSTLIDLYIFEVANVPVQGETVTLVDSDFALSPIGKHSTNTNQNDLLPREYIIGVDIRQLPIEGLSYPITYSLRVWLDGCGIFSTFSRSVIYIADWYETELPFTATLNVNLEGSTDSFVLFGDSGATIIDYGVPSFDSETYITDSSNLARTLRAGTYQIGVFHVGDTDTEYELSIDYSP